MQISCPETFKLEKISSRGGGGEGHFHVAIDMDVQQIKVHFFSLKSAKGVFLASKVCKGCYFQAIKVSNVSKIILLRNFSHNAKIYS